MKKFLSLSMLMVELSIIAFIACGLSLYFTGEISALVSVTSFVGIIGLMSLVKPVSGVAYETVPYDIIRSAQTNVVVAIYREAPVVKSFLRALFPTVTSQTKFISIAVQRGSEKEAVDIIRGGGSNLNQITKNTLKTFLPPYFNEEFMQNELEIYDTAWTTLNPEIMRQLAVETANEMQRIIDKIDRSYERYCAQVLQTGVVLLQNHDSIDFRRDADSMVDDAAQYFSGANDPSLAFTRAGKFLREKGKVQSGRGARYLCILGGAAFRELKANAIFQAEFNLKHVNPGDIIPAEMGTDGASYHGYISVDNYVYDLWTYPEGSEDANGDFVPYIDDNNMIVTTYTPNFQFVYGMVPQIPGVVVPMNVKEGFHTLEYVDTRQMNHGQRIMSAGVPVPVAVNQIYTQKVVAS